MIQTSYCNSCRFAICGFSAFFSTPVSCISQSNYPTQLLSSKFAESCSVTRKISGAAENILNQYSLYPLFISVPFMPLLRSCKKTYVFCYNLCFIILEMSSLFFHWMYSSHGTFCLLQQCDFQKPRKHINAGKQMATCW